MKTLLKIVELKGLQGIVCRHDLSHKGGKECALFFFPVRLQVERKRDLTGWATPLTEFAEKSAVS